MAMETAAAILTKLAVEQNTDFKSRLNAAHGEATVVALIMPLFRQILSELEKDRETHDKFPSAVPPPSPGRLAKAAPSGLGNTKDPHAEHRDEEHEDIGGEG
jgi:hypothetical protein